MLQRAPPRFERLYVCQRLFHLWGLCREDYGASCNLGWTPKARIILHMDVSMYGQVVEAVNSYPLDHRANLFDDICSFWMNHIAHENLPEVQPGDSEVRII